MILNSFEKFGNVVPKHKSMVKEQYYPTDNFGKNELAALSHSTV